MEIVRCKASLTKITYMLKIFKLPILSIALIGLFSISVASAGNDFPNRKKYSKVEIITLEDLYQKRNNVIIVDTRSGYEYSTLHIKNAINIPISSFGFSKKISQLYSDKKKTIVFYCNGHACTKSYDAVLKSKRFAKVKDTVAFDGGIFDWVNRYPNHSVLLKKSPINPQDLISKEEFSVHLLKPRAFLDKSEKNCLILDVRDMSQREDRIFAGQEHSVSLDNVLQLDKYFNDAKKKKKSLCIYDAVGKQVRWLQYRLKSKSVTDYYFLEGGAKAFYETPEKELYGN